MRTDDANSSALVDQACEGFQARGIRPHFVSRLTRPAGLAQLLQSRGCSITERETQMVLAGEDRESAPGLDVAVGPIELSDIEGWARMQHRAFGMGVPSAAAMRLARVTFDFGGFRPYVARLDGTAVGAATLIAWQGVFGIYGVPTPICLQAGGRQ